MGRHLRAMEDSGNFLMHYGRKGMKWGQHIFTNDDQLRSALKKRKELQNSQAYKNLQSEIQSIGKQRHDYVMNHPKYKKYKNPRANWVEASKTYTNLHAQWNTNNLAKALKQSSMIQQRNDMFKKHMGFDINSKANQQLNDAREYLSGSGGSYFSNVANTYKRGKH